MSATLAPPTAEAAPAPDAPAAPDAPPTTRATRPAGAAHLTDAQVAEFGRELDALRASVVDSLGASDAAYIRGMIQLHRVLEVAGRGLLLGGRRPLAFAMGTGLLAVAKVLENMEIGHNVIHGQWDWMRDPDIHSTTWEWDFVAPASGWKHNHNDLHHAWTNVVGKDRDVGYSILRAAPEQPWQPRHLFNLPINAVLAPFFEWGIAIYGLSLDEVRAGTKSRESLRADLRELRNKALRMLAKDSVATPLLAHLLTRSGPQALVGTALANMARNVWAHAVIFCGHFPDGVETFSEESIVGETRGDWYIRQLLGSANMSGGKVFHIMTGNLSHQIEHHLFPDLPSNHYAEVAPKVREICRRYGLPYVTGPMHRQIAQTWRTIARLSLP